MKSEMSRKSDMFHPYTLVIHPDFKELGDFILFFAGNVLKKRRYRYS